MQWKKRNAQINDIEELVEHNTNMSIYDFLHPIENPYLKNMKEACEFVSGCIGSGMPVKIVGDYDCDGVMSSAILKLVIEEVMGKAPQVRLPRRFSEGYGLSMKIIDETDEGLIITVDNGIAAVEQIKAAKDKGLKVVVLDHHLPPNSGELPPADIIVDAHAEEESEFKYYCGAGLAFRFAKEFLPDSKLLSEMQVLAGIATVADMMPLVGANRTLVAESLNLIRRRKVTLGLNVLLGLLNLSYVTESDYGFKIGPIVNASGRLYDDGPVEVMEFMSTHRVPEDPDYDAVINTLEAKAEELIERNYKRQELERSSTNRMIRFIQDNGLKDASPLVVYDKECSEGIIGIVAGKLAEKYRVPTIVFTDSSIDGVLKGSARTFGDVNLWEMLCSASDCFVKCGGHAEAAGMSIKTEKLEEMQRRTHEYLERTEFDRHKDENVIFYDIEISANEVPKYMGLIQLYAPYGQGNPAPVFKVNEFRCSPVGGKHFKILGKSEEHVKLFGKTNAIMFFAAKRYTDEGSPMALNLIGNLNQNYFNGKFYDQIEVEDFKKKEDQTSDLCLDLQQLLTFA